MNRTLVDLWVGFFAALGLAAIVFLALKVANQSSFRAAPSYEVHAYFTNIGGLKLRSPVKSAGVVVGRVTDIQLDTTNYQAKVSMMPACAQSLLIARVAIYSTLHVGAG